MSTDKTWNIWTKYKQLKPCLCRSAEPRTATSQHGVNNNNYHSNVSCCVLKVRKEPEDCKYAQSTQVSFPFNATSGCQQREQLLLDLIRSRELKEVGQDPEEHTLIHWTSGSWLKASKSWGKNSPLQTSVCLAEPYRPVPYICAKQKMSLFPHRYVLKNSAPFQQQDFVQNMR